MVDTADPTTPHVGCGISKAFSGCRMGTASALIFAKERLRCVCEEAVTSLAEGLLQAQRGLACSRCPEAQYLKFNPA